MGDKGFHTYHKDFSPKVNVIARLKLELADFDVTIQQANHYTKGNLLRHGWFTTKTYMANKKGL